MNKVNEINCSQCVAVVDVKKTFDTISPGCLFDALLVQQILKAYVNSSQDPMLTNAAMYDAIERSTKQGDPINPILFNATQENDAAL